MVVIEILDGQGAIPDQTLKGLFDKFCRIPGTRIGAAGLGMDIAKTIIEAHKGVIFPIRQESGRLSVAIIIGNPDQD